MRTKNQVFVAWLLLAVFLSPYVSKNIHLHDVSCHASDHVHHDCDDCPVCQFLLSSFVEVEFASWAVLPVHSSIQPKTYIEKAFIEPNSSHYLRAPPYIA